VPDRFGSHTSFPGLKVIFNPRPTVRADADIFICFYFFDTGIVNPKHGRNAGILSRFINDGIGEIEAIRKLPFEPQQQAHSPRLAAAGLAARVNHCLEKSMSPNAFSVDGMSKK